MKNLSVYCEEVTSVQNKVTNNRIKGVGHLCKVVLVIYYYFGHLGGMHLQNSKLTWMLPGV